MPTPVRFALIILFDCIMFKFTNPKIISVVHNPTIIQICIFLSSYWASSTTPGLALQILEDRVFSFFNSALVYQLVYLVYKFILAFTLHVHCYIQSFSVSLISQNPAFNVPFGNYDLFILERD